MPIINFIVNKYIWTAFCAGSWCFSFLYKESSTVNCVYILLYTIFVFILTILAYNFQNLNVKNDIFNPNFSSILFVATFIFSILFYVAKKNLNNNIIWLILLIMLCVIITLTYKKHLRKIVFFKPLLIAFCWTVICIFLPGLIFNYHIDFIFLTEVFMIATTISILFDIKQINEDTGKIKTFATLLGKNKCILLCSILFVIAGTINFLTNGKNINIAFYLFYAAMFPFIIKIKKNYLFTLLSEGTLIIHSLFLIK